MLTEMMAYADLRHLQHGEERIEFVRYMRVMDAAFIKHVSQKDSVTNV